MRVKHRLASQPVSVQNHSSSLAKFSETAQGRSARPSKMNVYLVIDPEEAQTLPLACGYGARFVGPGTDDLPNRFKVLFNGQPNHEARYRTRNWIVYQSAIRIDA